MTKLIYLGGDLNIEDNVRLISFRDFLESPQADISFEGWKLTVVHKHRC